MTAHELARKLLECSDVDVIYHDTLLDYYPDVETVKETEIYLWQTKEKKPVVMLCEP